MTAVEYRAVYVDTGRKRMAPRWTPGDEVRSKPTPNRAAAVRWLQAKQSTYRGCDGWVEARTVTDWHRCDGDPA